MRPVFISVLLAGCVGTVEEPPLVEEPDQPPPAADEKEAVAVPVLEVSVPAFSGAPGAPPPPAPGGCRFPQGVPDADFIASATSNTDTDPVVDAAVNAAMRSLTGCNPGSSCPLSSYPGANQYEKCQSWFAAVNAKLREQGFCAGLHEEGQTDEIAVSNTGCSGRWYGYHVCNYGGPLVVWTPGARRGWWQISPARCPQ